jgi:hypothetical protein
VEEELFLEASSGITATPLEDGLNAHATFKLTLNVTTSVTPVCNILKQSNFAEVLKKYKNNSAGRNYNGT